MIMLIIGWMPVLFAFMYHWIFGTITSAIWLLLVLLPIEGFHKPQVDTLELMRLKLSNKGQTYYLWRLENNKILFAYDNSDMYDLDGGAYEEDVRKGKIKVYESEYCEEPILKTYITRPKRDFFTFAPFSTKTEYVLYVPEGTVFNCEYSSHPKNREEVIVV